MNTIRTSKISKGIVDIMMLLCLIGCINSASVFEESMKSIHQGAGFESVFSWGTLHCLIGLAFVFLMGIHIWQRWNFYKALIRKQLYLKNKLTTFATISFLLLIISLLLFLTGFTSSTLHFHFIFAHIFAITIIVHSCTRLKQLIYLFRKKAK
jgi:hypothetical protein